MPGASGTRESVVVRNFLFQKKQLVEAAISVLGSIAKITPGSFHSRDETGADLETVGGGDGIK